MKSFELMIAKLVSVNGGHFSVSLIIIFNVTQTPGKKKEKKLKRRLITVQKPKKGHQNYFFM